MCVLGAHWGEAECEFIEYVKSLLSFEGNRHVLVPLINGFRLSILHFRTVHHNSSANLFAVWRVATGNLSHIQGGLLLKYSKPLPCFFKGFSKLRVSKRAKKWFMLSP